MHKEDFIWGMICVLVISVVVGYCFWIRSNDNKIKIIDNCQYIQHYNGKGWDLIHKGNCTNIIHTKNK